MSYILNRTDGSLLITLDDGTINQTETSITLVGKNASSYGEFFNENFIHLLENFSNTIQPDSPIVGQLWYDSGEGRLKVWDGSTFKVSGGTIVSGIAPSVFTQGDLWIDSANQQLHFYDGENRILAGPIYTSTQGVSGFVVEDVADDVGIYHTVMKLYVSQILLGIYSKDEFTPQTAIAGFAYPGVIKIGFNVGSYSGVKYDVPVTKALALVAEDGSLKNAENFLTTTNTSTTSGTIVIQNSVPLILGLNQNIEFDISTAEVKTNSTISDQNYSINLLNINGIKPSFFIDAHDEHIGLYTNSPTETLDVNGNARIRGNLVVEGNTTTINTTNIEIEDLLVELGKVNTPTNLTASGGGISVLGGVDGDKTWSWQSTTDAWTSTDHIDLAAGKSYYVNGIEVLSQTALGSAITSAPGLSSIGALTTLQVSNLSFTAPASISFVNNLLVNGDITLVPKGTGSVNVSNSTIENLADPVNSNDAVNKQTLLLTTRSKSLAFYADTTGLSDGLIGSSILDKVYPYSDVEDGAICRIMCINSGVSVFKKYIMTSGAWIFAENIL